MMGTGYSGLIDIFSRSRELTWTQRFAWWPKRSDQSGQRIWLKKYWYGTRLVWGIAGESPARVEHWLTDEEYFWHQLTQSTVG